MGRLFMMGNNLIQKATLDQVETSSTKSPTGHLKVEVEPTSETWF
jgi:hypothetical protein